MTHLEDGNSLLTYLQFDLCSLQSVSITIARSIQLKSKSEQVPPPLKNLQGFPITLKSLRKALLEAYKTLYN